MKNAAKYANWYDKDGNIINKKDDNGCTRNYTIEELEELVDVLGEDKNEDGTIKNPVAFNNASAILFQMYQKYGNPHEQELIERAKTAQKNKTTMEEKEKALQEVASELDTTEHEIPIDVPVCDRENDDRPNDNGEYVEFEEV